MSGVDAATAARLLSLLDLTSLREDDTPTDIRALCDAATEGVGRPAAVCVWPELVATACERLEHRGAREVAVATVVNFPDGSDDVDRAARETRRAIAAGAAEIDLVFPWRAFVGGDRERGRLMIEACREACGERPLKAILESGELRDPLLVADVAGAALDAGADFVKTSTGKTPSGATAEAARAMLGAIRERGGRQGFKASGGIRNLADAVAYLRLAEDTMGEGWADPRHFRIGASRILDEIRSAMAARSGAG